jgi:fibronectin-binding autotransporter adhesin
MRRNLHTFVWVAVSIAMLLATLSGTASAQTYTWIGGSRTWDTSSLNWNGGTVAWPTTGTNNDALFGSTSGATTITIQSGGVTANDLQFSGTAYTLTGGALTLNGATPTITLTPASSGFTAQIGSTLAGSNGFGVTSSGGGVLDTDWFQ